MRKWIEQLFFYAVLMVIAVFLILKGLYALNLMPAHQEIEEIPSVQWTPATDFRLPDIAVLSFDSLGRVGIAASADGEMAITRDGGRSWHKWTKAPIEIGEMVGAVIFRDGELYIGTAVAESAYTTIYKLGANRQWSIANKGSYGGIAVAGNNELMVGGSGLVVRWNADKWSFSKLPQCGQYTLYAAAGIDKRLLVAGDEGLIAESLDGGRSWRCNQLIESTQMNRKALYSVAVGKNVSLAGGHGVLWRRDEQGWNKLKVTEERNAIFALYLDSEGKEAYAGGGDEAGGNPMMLHSSDGGTTWQREAVKQVNGRIVAIAKGEAGIFAATMDGRILKRVN